MGWIDSVRYSLDAERAAQRFTPRRKGSNWSAVNIAKIQTLTEQGRMRPAGIAAFALRTEARSGVYSLRTAPRGPARPGRRGPLPGERGGVDPVPGKGAVVPGRRDVLDRQRQAARDPGGASGTLIEDSAAGRTIKPLTPPGTPRSR